MSRLRQILGLVAFLAIAYAVAALGSVATISQVDGWYADADKVPWNPPSVVFGPVWTVLYTLMAVAAWLVWRQRERTDVRRPLTLYVIQLVVNAVWTPVFFGLYPVIGVVALWIAVAIIVALDVLVLLTLRSFWPVHRAAALLLVPYAAWVLFATTLTIGIAVLQY
jgi:tryptophan-rich sensory protein